MNRGTKLVFGACAMLLVPSLAMADSGRGRWHGNNNGWRGNHGNYNNGYHNGYNNWNSNWGRNGGGRGYYYGSGDWGIRNGIRSGELSRAEARELRGDLAEIRRDRASYLSDGRLSANERKELRDDMQDYRENLQHNLNDGEKGRGGRNSWWGW